MWQPCGCLRACEEFELDGGGVRACDDEGPWLDMGEVAGEKDGGDVEGVVCLDGKDDEKVETIDIESVLIK